MNLHLNTSKNHLACTFTGNGELSMQSVWEAESGVGGKAITHLPEDQVFPLAEFLAATKDRKRFFHVK